MLRYPANFKCMSCPTAEPMGMFGFEEHAFHHYEKEFGVSAFFFKCRVCDLKAVCSSEFIRHGFKNHNDPNFVLDDNDIETLPFNPALVSQVREFAEHDMSYLVLNEYGQVVNAHVYQQIGGEVVEIPRLQPIEHRPCTPFTDEEDEEYNTEMERALYENDQENNGEPQLNQ